MSDGSDKSGMESNSPMENSNCRAGCMLAVKLPGGKLSRGEALRWLLRISRCALLVFGVLAVVVLLNWRTILYVTADLWEVDERPASADAAHVLGGGWLTRSMSCARLFHQGKVSKILISDVLLTTSDRLGETIPETKRLKSLLGKLGVPADRIEVIGDQLSSTYEESIALNSWLSKHPGASVMIPTQMFHTRRVRWIMNRRAVGDTGARIFVSSIPSRDYRAENWWLNEDGVISFQNEIIKSLVYWLRF